MDTCASTWTIIASCITKQTFKVWLLSICLDASQRLKESMLEPNCTTGILHYLGNSYTGEALS